METHGKGDSVMKKDRILVLVLVVFVIMLVILLTGCGTKPMNENQTPEDAKQAADTAKTISVEQGIKTSTAAMAGDCGECHAMAPEIETWKLTSHSNFPCTACHGEKASDYSDITPSLPVELSEEVSSENCKQCHSANRMYTPSGDLIIPHEKHDKVGIICVKCHSGVVHANIAEREITKQEEFKDLSKWDVKMAEKVVTKYYTQPSMWTCIDCHKGMGITRACSACHSEINGLPSHEVKEWEVVHGKSGRGNIDECTRCHSIPGEQKFVEPSTGDKVADFARANNFCYKCHSQKPESHSGDVLPNHPSLAFNRGLVNCFTCHDRNRPGVDENVTATYCNQCHWFEKGKPAIQQQKDVGDTEEEEQKD